MACPSASWPRSARAHPRSCRSATRRPRAPRGCGLPRGSPRGPTTTRSPPSWSRGPTTPRPGPGTCVPGPPSASWRRPPRTCSCRSCASLPVRCSRSLRALLERGFQAAEAPFPQAAILREPRVQLAERRRPERVEPSLSVRPHRDEACFVQDAQMARDSGLVDPGSGNDVVDLPLAVAQHLDDTPAGGVCQGLEGIDLHLNAYAYTRIYMPSNIPHGLRRRPTRTAQRGPTLGRDLLGG